MSLMEIIITVIRSLAGVAGSLAALFSILFFIQLHWPAPVLWFLKIYSSALSPLFVLIGLTSTVVGLATGLVITSWIGIYTVLVFCRHIFVVTRPPGDPGNFENAFGLHWEDKIDPGLKKYFLPARTVLKLPAVPHPRIEHNISFATIPGTDRKLLCDIWRPPGNVVSTGLTLIYLHGGTWYLLDKDLGTRPFFSHLCAQGHVIMDVAYRLAPETDMMGMLNDVKRAIAWMKENAPAYQTDPGRIVIGGGSAGGHLALMAAYTAIDPQFSPKELEGRDTSVAAVISLYGPVDLVAMYYHTNQHLTTRSAPGEAKKTGPTQLPGWVIKKMGKEYHRLNMDKGFENAGAFAPLMGGHPDECPGTYSLFSPCTHIHSECPPTLLIHGKQDVLAPVQPIYTMYNQLVKKKIPAVMHILPQTDHGFDLQLPNLSPSAHNAFFDVERFMALMV